MKIDWSMVRLGRPLIISAALVWLPSASQAYPSANEAWQELTSAEGSATARHEAGMVAVGDRMYLLGGRGNRPVEYYDVSDNAWRKVGQTPEAFHHVQPVHIGTSIYVIGGLLGGFPDELPMTTIYRFDTESENWSSVGEMPEDRARGSTAAVVHQGEIYIVGGNLNGHEGPSVAWFDRFDPASGQWTRLADAPHARDHASAAVVDGQLVMAGGRRSDLPNPFDKTVAAVDIYDFETNQWRNGQSLPTLRAGAPVVAYEEEVIVIGGEASTSSEAFGDVEAYDVAGDSWRTLQSLIAARHSGGAAVIGDTLHVVAGNLQRGGGAETSRHETLALDSGTNPDPDGDGLSSDDEVDQHGTDPADADTDDDGLDDGREIELATDPQQADTDQDGLYDGREVDELLTDPRRSDTDGDGIGDGDEVAAGTDPHDANDPAGSGTGGTGGSSAGGSDTGATDTGGSDTGGTGTGGSDTEGTGTAGSDTGGTATGGTDQGNGSGGDDSPDTDGESAGSADGSDAGSSDSSDGGNEPEEQEGRRDSGGGAVSPWWYLVMLIGSLVRVRARRDDTGAQQSRRSQNG